MIAIRAGDNSPRDRISPLTLVAIATYAAFIVWIALYAVEADPPGELPGGVATGIATVLWLAGSIGVGFLARRWALLGLPATVSAIALVYSAFETKGYDLPLTVENEAWAISLLLGLALESALLAIGIALGQQRQRG